MSILASTRTAVPAMAALALSGALLIPASPTHVYTTDSVTLTQSDIVEKAIDQVSKTPDVAAVNTGSKTFGGSSGDDIAPIAQLRGLLKSVRQSEATIGQQLSKLATQSADAGAAGSIGSLAADSAANGVGTAYIGSDTQPETVRWDLGSGVIPGLAYTNTTGSTGSGTIGIGSAGSSTVGIALAVYGQAKPYLEDVAQRQKTGELTPAEQALFAPLFALDQALINAGVDLEAITAVPEGGVPPVVPPEAKMALKVLGNLGS